jgi:hypothetical protein
MAWLADQAIPEFVPGALRRTRAGELVGDALLTTRELAARHALREFDKYAAAEWTRLEADRAEAAAAGKVRSALLYESGKSLVEGVAGVLASVGFEVEDLDERFGAGRSADLLATMAERHWLVEVKAAAAAAGERLVADLERHLRTWAELSDQALEGGVLVVNHQHRLPPLERTTAVYDRPEFVASLCHPVIPTLALFSWWPDGDQAVIVDAVTGPPGVVRVEWSRRSSGSNNAVVDAAPLPAKDPATPAPRRGWFWRRVRS